MVVVSLFWGNFGNEFGLIKQIFFFLRWSQRDKKSEKKTRMPKSTRVLRGVGLFSVLGPLDVRSRTTHRWLRRRCREVFDKCPRKLSRRKRCDRLIGILKASKHFHQPREHNQVLDPF